MRNEPPKAESAALDKPEAEESDEGDSSRLHRLLTSWSLQFPLNTCTSENLKVVEIFLLL
jgi:hypothetical protein